MRIHLSLGSNVGDRISHLRSALEALDRWEGVRVTAVSQVYETEPVGKTDQRAFLNLAAEIETDLDPLELLNAAKAIERAGGRVPGERWGPRPIDIDIVLWSSRVWESETLTLPHPAFRERAFVLAPLAEIAADAVDPVTGLTVAQLAARPEVQGRVERKGPLYH